MSFLFVDRLLESGPGPQVRGIKTITAHEPYLSTETGKPSFIPALIGETLGQLAAWRVMQYHHFTLRPVAGVVSSTEMLRPVYVGETLWLESTIENLDDKAVQYNGVAKVEGEAVFRLEGAIGPLLPMTDFIAIDTVKKQFESIYQPGSEPKASMSAKAQPSFSLQYDTILAFAAGQHIQAEKNIDPQAPYFPDHFPNNPVLPMTILLECTMNLAKTFMQRSFAEPYRICGLQRIKMNDFIKPGSTVSTQISVKSQGSTPLILSCRSEVENKRVCVAEILLQPQENLL